MANKPLQTIKFPGLTNTYTVPQVDSNFTGTAGQVPDSKKVHDEIDSLKEDLNAMSSATSSDVGKALKAKTVTDGKVVEWEFGEADDITVPIYDATKTYPVGSYVMYNGQMYRNNVPITTAEAWTASHWDAITASDLIADMNTRLDMLVTMQEVEEDEPVEGIVQLVDLSNITWRGTGDGKCRAIPNSNIALKGDGSYYCNPYGAAINSVGKWYLFYAQFADADGNQLTLTSTSDGSTVTYLTMGGNIDNKWRFEIENGRTLKYYNSDVMLAGTYTTTANIAYLRFTGQPMFAYFDDYNAKFGLTYGGSSASYVAYESGEETEPTYEYQYVPALAQYVEAYMQSRGTAVDNTIFEYFYPTTDNSEFVNAVKYYHERADRQRKNIIRVGSFNKFVSRGKSNWSTIKQELADYSLDICGFQECAAIQSGGVITTQIGAYLQGWQFKGYAPQDTVVDKAIVSHWTVTHTDLITLLTYDNSAGTSNCIHALMTIPTDKWYSNAVNADATLSVYCYHGKSSGATIGGTTYTSYQVRQMEINALLAVIASDTSDFIVIVGDTNAFEAGFDIHTGTHAEWEMFRNAGFTPVLDGHDSTVTADLQDKYFCKADNDEVFCVACYDQIFVGANITAKRFGVVDSNLYPVESLGGVPVSDHCMVYADLEFDFDAVQQAKLAEIAVTTPWW